jgi:hypothetical protein
VEILLRLYFQWTQIVLFWRDTVFDWCSVGRHLRNARWCFCLARKRGVSDCCLRETACVYRIRCTEMSFQQFWRLSRTHIQMGTDLLPPGSVPPLLCPATSSRKSQLISPWLWIANLWVAGWRKESLASRLANVQGSHVSPRFASGFPVRV